MSDVTIIPNVQDVIIRPVDTTPVISPIFGEVGPTGPVGPVGPSGAPGHYGAFYSTTTQTNLLPVNTITFDSVYEADGVSIQNSSEIEVAFEGTYNVQFSLQLDKIDAGDDEVDIWFAINGADVPNSNTTMMVHANNGKAVPAWNFVVTLAANDHVQIRWYAPDVTMRLLAVPAGARPAVPSAIVTITQVMNNVQGPQGDPGVPGVHIGTTPPSDTSLLWVDTS